MRLTKKAYRELLNAQDIERQAYVATRPEANLADKYRNGVYGQRKRLYGDYLYNQDRDTFNMYYAEWIARGGKD